MNLQFMMLLQLFFITKFGDLYISTYIDLPNLFFFISAKYSIVCIFDGVVLLSQAFGSFLCFLINLFFNSVLILLPKAPRVLFCCLLFLGMQIFDVDCFFHAQSLGQLKKVSLISLCPVDAFFSSYPCPEGITLHVSQTYYICVFKTRVCQSNSPTQAVPILCLLVHNVH